MARAGLLATTNLGLSSTGKVAQGLKKLAGRTGSMREYSLDRVLEDGGRGKNLERQGPEFLETVPEGRAFLIRRNYYGKPLWQGRRQKEYIRPSHVRSADGGRRSWALPSPQMTSRGKGGGKTTREDRDKVGPPPCLNLGFGIPSWGRQDRKRSLTPIRWGGGPTMGPTYRTHLHFEVPIMSTFNVRHRR